MHTLLSQTKDLVKKEKHFTYLILNNLKRIEENKLYCDLGHSSLHAYLEKELGYSSAESALRVANVKLMKISSLAEEKIKVGEINLTQGGNLLLAFNKSEILDKTEKMEEALSQIKGKSTRESDKLIQGIFEIKAPLQDKITLSERLKEKIERLKKIYGEKSFEEIIEILVDEKLMEETIAPKKEILAVKNIENPKDRYIPISLKRAVVVRAQKQCEYHSRITGVRCHERRNLEFEHVIPYSQKGGHTLDNLKLYCKGHNQRQGILKIDCFLAMKKKRQELRKWEMKGPKSDHSRARARS